MNLRSSVSAVLAASLLLSSVPAFAAGDSSSSASSASSTDVRLRRCARFAKSEDYERCARLVRRMPVVRGSASSSPASASTPTSSSSADSSVDGDWQWSSLYVRMEKKIETMVKFASTMGRRFCRDQAEDNGVTSQECMLRLKTEMKLRVDKLIDVAFRGDLPSSR